MMMFITKLTVFTAIFVICLGLTALAQQDVWFFITLGLSFVLIYLAGLEVGKAHTMKDIVEAVRAWHKSQRDT